MKCPQCGAWTRTLETRTDEHNNQIWRRKECGNLHTFATLEGHAGSMPRPNNKRMVAVRQSRPKGVEDDAPVYRRSQEDND